MRFVWVKIPRHFQLHLQLSKSCKAPRPCRAAAHFEYLGLKRRKLSRNCSCDIITKLSVQHLKALLSLCVNFSRCKKDGSTTRAEWFIHTHLPFLLTYLYMKYMKYIWNIWKQTSLHGRAAAGQKVYTHQFCVDFRCSSTINSSKRSATTYHGKCSLEAWPLHGMLDLLKNTFFFWTMGRINYISKQTSCYWQENHKATLPTSTSLSPST